MSEKRYKPCKPYRLSTIGVCLFGRPFFPEGYDLCPRQWYTDQFDGKTDDWLTDTSFERLQSQVEDYLRFVYPRFNSAWISFNWALLLGSFLIGIVPFFLGLFIIYLNGDKSRLAFKEMMKRAFDLEIEARQHDVPPEGREVDIISHHLVCAYFESFQRLSYSLLDPITWFRKFGQLQDVEVFCKKCTGVITDEYELWNGHKELAPAAIQKAVEKLSHPRGGGSMRYIFLFITTLILFVTSVLLSIFLDKNPPYQPEVSLAVGCTVIVIYVSVSLLYLWTWIPVARKIAGLVRPSTERWADEGRISRDAIDAVTDLGMLSILVTELDKERMYLPSMMYWQNVAPALSDEPPESAKHSIRSGLSRVSVARVRCLPFVCMYIVCEGENRGVLSVVCAGLSSWSTIQNPEEAHLSTHVADASTCLLACCFQNKAAQCLHSNILSYHYESHCV